jgi:hypothetical protein
MNVEKHVEIPIARVLEMLAWCRDNRLPLIHRWIEPVLNWDGDHVDDAWHSCGTRGLFGHYTSRSGSMPYNDDEQFTILFWIRDRDLPLWLIRFS